MRVEALREMYAPLVAEGAAEYLYDQAGQVTAVLLTHVDHERLAAVEKAYGEELQQRFVRRDQLEREARSRLDLEHFILD